LPAARVRFKSLKQARAARALLPAALPPLVLVLATIAIGWKLIASPFQYAINDFGPFGSAMLRNCPLDYQMSSLGVQNAHVSPSSCDYGALAALLGGANGQHLFFLGSFALAGLTMYFLLRRIGNSKPVSLLGAAAYELSPIMFSFYTSGEGLLVMSALLPGILLGAVPQKGKSPITEGARSGAILAAVCYANAQAPAFVAFLAVPLIGVLLWGRARNIRYASLFCASLAVVFGAAAVPVIQILPGFGRMIQSSQATLQGDLAIRLAWNSLPDFFTPYLVLGAIPAILGLVLLARFRDVRPAEFASGISLAAIFVLWELLRRVGPVVAGGFPLITMYKDFIKLQILLAIPLIILSAMSVRWAIASRTALSEVRGSLIVALLAGLMLLPVAFGHQPKLLYVTGFTPVSNGQAILSGELGLPSWAAVPPRYTQVLQSLRRADPDTRTYRILWAPMDWRLIQLARAVDTNLLLYSPYAAVDARQAVSSTFDAIANGQRDRIAPLLGEQGVKYLVVDLADGQDRNSEPWEKGPPINLSVWGTRALVGRASDYNDVLSNTPGLQLIATSGSWAIYRNGNWRPIMTTYAGILALGPSTKGVGSQANEKVVPLGFIGYPSSRTAYGDPVHWRKLSTNSIRVDAAVGPADETRWSPVSAIVPVTGGASYRFSGTMSYRSVIQSHAKVIWRGSVVASDATVYLSNGLDGTGTVQLNKTLIAPSGAVSAEVILMGGWTDESSGFTDYANLTLTLLQTPDLASVVGHAETLAPLARQLPDWAIEPDMINQSQATEVQVRTLVTGPTQFREDLAPVRILTAQDVVASGQWAVNALPDELGIERFLNQGKGSITIPASTLAAAPPGSTVAWIEYKPGDTGFPKGLFHSVTANGTVTITCQTSRCSIANVLLIPPLPTAKEVARFGYAFSPQLRTPNGGPQPLRVPGDWATFYSPPPLTIYPSPVFDSSTTIKIVGLMFGHLVVLLGLLFGLVGRTMRLNFWSRKQAESATVPKSQLVLSRD